MSELCNKTYYMHPLGVVSGGDATWGKDSGSSLSHGTRRHGLPCGICTREDSWDMVHHFPVAWPALEGFMEPILPSGGPTSPASVMLCAIEEILPYVEVSLY